MAPNPINDFVIFFLTGTGMTGCLFGGTGGFYSQ